MGKRLSEPQDSFWPSSLSISNLPFNRPNLFFGCAGNDEYHKTVWAVLLTLLSTALVCAKLALPVMTPPEQSSVSNCPAPVQD